MSGCCADSDQDWTQGVGSCSHHTRAGYDTVLHLVSSVMGICSSKGQNADQWSGEGSGHILACSTDWCRLGQAWCADAGLLNSRQCCHCLVRG